MMVKMMEDGRIDDEDKGDHRWKDTRWAQKDTNGLEGQRSSGLITCWVRVTKGGKSLMDWGESRCAYIHECGYTYTGMHSSTGSTAVQQCTGTTQPDTANTA